MRISKVLMPFHFEKHHVYKDVSLEVTHQGHLDDMKSH
jgi:hypothetical protein